MAEQNSEGNANGDLDSVMEGENGAEESPKK